MISKQASFTHPRFLFCAAMILAGGSSKVAAGDIFTATATTTDTTPPITITESGNHLIPLTEDVGGTSRAFSAFDHTDFTGHLSKAGVDFLDFTVDLRGQDTATFRLPNGRLLTTINAKNSSDLQHQIELYFKGNATSITTNVNSPIEVSDGNPNAATATAAAANFTAFSTGTANLRSQELDYSYVDPLTVDAAAFRADGANGSHFDGYRITVPLSLTYHLPHVFDDRVGLELNGEFTYVNVNSTNTYEGGLFLGVPVQIIRRHSIAGAGAGGKDGKDGKSVQQGATYSRLAWSVTPYGGAIVTGSEALVEGGIIYIGGLSSALSYDLTDRMTITLGDAFTVAEGGTLNIGEYSLNDQTDQVIFKNGFSLSYRMNDRFALEGQALATNFVNDAAIPVYASLALQTVFNQPVGRDGRSIFVARIGFITDQAPDYHSYGGRFSLGLSF